MLSAGPSPRHESPPMVMEWQVEEPARRLDQHLVQRGISPSRSHIQRLIQDGHVTVNGFRAKPSLPLKPGDRVRVALPPLACAPLEPEAMPIHVVFEDGDVIVIDKPAGLTVHPGAGRPRGTLANALLSRWPALAGAGNALRPGIVHRLDKDTSGLMMVAKTQEAYLTLCRQIKERQVQKTYLALVKGDLRPCRGRIEAPIGRNRRYRGRMAVVEKGRPASTEYQVLEHLQGHTLLEAHPLTGRTHQIRVHLAAIGHPLLGDPVYGQASPLLGRQFLHASGLGFRLPGTGEYREFSSELPEELKRVLQELRGSVHVG